MTKILPEFLVKLTALVIDIALVLMLAWYISEPLKPIFDVLPDKVPLVLLILTLIAYFSLFWLSPLKATPAQWVLGIRVTDLNYQRLTPKASFIRSLILVIAVALLEISLVFSSSLYVWLAFVPLSLIFLAVFSPSGQSFHDYLSGSITINRKALDSEVILNELTEFLDNTEHKGWLERRPAIWRLLINLFVVIGLTMITVVSVQIHKQKNLAARTHYAYQETQALQILIAEYYFMEGQLPIKADVLSHPIKTPYPDGGYFELLDNGQIKIQFEILPELKSGHLLLVPVVEKDSIVWRCEILGQFEARYAPRTCITPSN